MYVIDGNNLVHLVKRTDVVVIVKILLIFKHQGFNALFYEFKLIKMSEKK